MNCNQKEKTDWTFFFFLRGDDNIKPALLTFIAYEDLTLIANPVVVNTSELMSSQLSNGI